MYNKYTKQAKLKAILEMSTFRIPKMEIFQSNGSFCNFYPNLPKNFFVLKINKSKIHVKRAPFKYPKWKFPSQINHSAVFKQLFSNFLYYTQNEQASTF